MIDGVTDGTCTHYTEGHILVPIFFGFGHSPPGRNRTFPCRLSADCTSLVLRAVTSSGRQELHLRPHGPEPRALLAELHPEMNEQRHGQGAGIETPDTPEDVPWARDELQPKPLRGSLPHHSLDCSRSLP